MQRTPKRGVLFLKQRIRFLVCRVISTIVLRYRSVRSKTMYEKIILRFRCVENGFAISSLKNCYGYSICNENIFEIVIYLCTVIAWKNVCRY